MLLGMRRIPIALLSVALLGGCASRLPPTITAPPPGDISISAVRSGAGNYSGRRVRWGGEIIQVVNRRQFTDISILAKPLSEEGKPRSGASAEGRFIARFQGFLEPEEYQTGRLITIVGRFTAIEHHKVGEYRYAYPVVEVTDQHKWPQPRPVTVPAYRYNPFLYDPWWPYTPYRYPYYPYWW